MNTETLMKEYEDMRHELIEYHILEQEFGIDLKVLSKARKEVWYKIEVTEYEGGANSWNMMNRYDFVHNSIVTKVDFKNKTVYIQGAKKWFPFSELGETWALTKGELE